VDSLVFLLFKGKCSDTGFLIRYNSFLYTFRRGCFSFFRFKGMSVFFIPFL